MFESTSTATVSSSVENPSPRLKNSQQKPPLPCSTDYKSRRGRLAFHVYVAHLKSVARGTSRSEKPPMITYNDFLLA
jgi:hypothetical protein